MISREALRSADLEVEGRLPWSSNYTFLVNGNWEGESFSAVYKPEDGEQPLADFPPGLFRREAAAYELAAILGWPNIPPTVVREDGPFGTGSLQLFVEADFEQHYLTFAEREDLAGQLLDIAVFDVVANNTDRKSGHCLLVGSDVFAIDNGLCFHQDPKLRTVIWEFAGADPGQQRIERLQRLVADMPPAVSALLADGEIEAIKERTKALIAARVMPELLWQRQIPWPPI